MMNFASSRMSQTRYKKLCMARGYSRDEADTMAWLVRLEDRLNGYPRIFYEGREFAAYGYRYNYENNVFVSPKRAMILKRIIAGRKGCERDG